MKLAILVVYFLEDDDLPILDLHLRAIGEHTDGDFTVYGAATRVSERVVRRLRESGFVTLIEGGETGLRNSREHAYWLDRLAEQASRDGATHLCTLDVDSFPIRRGWAGALRAALGETMPLAAVLRAENGDSALPHPCCMFFSDAFYQAHRPAFFPEADVLDAEEFRRFLAVHGQTSDCGIGFGYALWRHGIPWLRLLRSNAMNDHYLLGGIYHGLIFHLGAMGRGQREFRRDKKRSLRLRFAFLARRRLQSAGSYGGLAQAIVERIGRSASSAISERNNRCYAHIRGRLIADPAGYLAYLSSGPAAPQGNQP